MPDKGTKKKVIRVASEESSAKTRAKKTPPVVNEETKAKAKTFRILAILAWIVAIAFQAGAIYLLQKTPINTTWLIGLIVADLIFAVTGSLLWKKANRFDPASEKEKVKFFIQNQLGAIISVIAFLPLVILIFTNKNMKGNQKAVLGAVAVVALVIAGIVGIDFDPVSIEQYAEQTAEVQALNNGVNYVYWTKSGSSYHLYSDCSYINTARTTEIYEGTVADARKLKNITDLCDRCKNRAVKAKELNGQ